MKFLIFLLCLSSATFFKGFARLLFFDLTRPYEQLFCFKILTATSLCAVFLWLLLIQRINAKNTPQNNERRPL